MVGRDLLIRGRPLEWRDELNDRAATVHNYDLARYVIRRVRGQEHGNAFNSPAAPTRAIGLRALIEGSADSMAASARREWKKPGAMALTRIPCRPHEAASSRVRPNSPALLAAYPT